MAATHDDIDWKILETLQEKGRTTMTELGSIIGLSQPASAERVRKLEDAGIITGYTVKIDYAKLGFGIEAILRVKTTRGKADECRVLLERLPSVLEAQCLAGDDCLNIKVVARSMEELERVGIKIAAFGLVETSIVLDAQIQKSISRSSLLYSVSS